MHLLRTWFGLLRTWLGLLKHRVVLLKVWCKYFRYVNMHLLKWAFPLLKTWFQLLKTQFFLLNFRYKYFRHTKHIVAILLWKISSNWSSDKLPYYHNITNVYNEHIFSVSNVKYQQKKDIIQICTSSYAFSILLTPTILCLLQNSFHAWTATTTSPALSPFSAQQEVTRSCKVASSCNHEFYTQNITYTQVLRPLEWASCVEGSRVSFCHFQFLKPNTSLYQDLKLSFR